MIEEINNPMPNFYVTDYFPNLNFFLYASFHLSIIVILQLKKQYRNSFSITCIIFGQWRNLNHEICAFVSINHSLIYLSRI